MRDLIANTALQATKRLINLDNELLDEIDFSDARSTLKSLFLTGQFDLTNGQECYCYDDFVAALLPESEEYLAACNLAAHGLPVDFAGTFNTVLNQWLDISIQSLSEAEIADIIRKI